MNHNEIPDAVQDRYKGAPIRGPRVTRLEENDLGYFRLDAGTAWELGKNNIGVFVGNCDSLSAIIERLRLLERADGFQRWVVVAATKKMAAVVITRWFRSESAKRVAVTTLKLPKVHSNIVLATPESLKRIDEAERQDIAGLLVIDTLYHIHKARQLHTHGFAVRNDRPQLIADFRSCLMHEGWAPPLILLTQKAAMSVTTDSAARAYCLDAWWFIDGSSLRCGVLRSPEAQRSESDTSSPD